MTDPLAAAILRALAADPEALDALRDLVDVGQSEPTAPPPAYTVASLASCLGLSEKAIRNAIGRGELAAVKRAGRWFIAPEAVQFWLAPVPPRRPRAGAGPLTDAMNLMVKPRRRRR